MRDMPRPVKLGGDWAGAVTGGLRARVSDLEHDAIFRTARRVRVAAVFFIACFAVAALRLADLTLLAPKLDDLVSASRAAPIVARPLILDRHGAVLATQIATTTLGANAEMVANPAPIVAALKAIIPDLNLGRVGRLLAGNSHYVVLHKGLSPEQRQRVLHLGNPALHLSPAAKRVYPSGAVAAHVLGYVGSDMQGLAGLERWLDSHAAPLPAGGLRTTLDLGVQHMMRDALQVARAQFKAKFAAAAMVDIRNGDVLALVSLPDFDPNRPGDPTARGHFNHMTLGTYEMGSIFKLFTAAMALEGGHATRQRMIKTASPLRIGAYQLTDKKTKASLLSLSDVVAYSSNTGTARLALSVPRAEHRAFLRRLGLTERAAFELLEAGQPQLPERWGAVERVTLSFGHGLAVTPLSALMAVAAMVNGGIVYPPRLVGSKPPHGRQVISPRVSRDMRAIMRAVVQRGTGRRAEVAAYGVMGKTGSADKPVAGGYDTSRLLTSFVGAFPFDAPRYALLVMLDEPQATSASHGRATAGWNAAPVAAQIISRAAPLLGLIPRRQNPPLIYEASYAP